MLVAARQGRTARIVAVSFAVTFATGLGGVAAATGHAITVGHGLAARAQIDRQAGGNDTQIEAVAGSARFLAYIEYATVDGHPAKLAQLFERTAQGATRKVGTVNRRLSEFSLVGRYLSSALVSADGRVRVWNLNTGREHDRTTPHLAEWFGAAPHGYLIIQARQDEAGYHNLATVSLSGTVTSLGSPFPSGSHYNVTVNAHRYVAYVIDGSRPRGVRTATFAHPGQITTVMRSNGRSSAPMTYCGVPSARFIACDTDSNRYALQIRSLSGKLVASTSRFDGLYQRPAMVAGSAYWLTQTPRSRLRQLTSAGTVTTSTREFANDDPISAFHEVILGARGKTALLALKSATAKPTLIVTAKGRK